jgi:hypothetical protein
VSATEAVPSPSSIVLDHVAAFNQHDRDRLLAGLAPAGVLAGRSHLFWS